jgi:hypothetical protein
MAISIRIFINTVIIGVYSSLDPLKGFENTKEVINGRNKEPIDT